MINLKIKIVRTPLGFEELAIKDGAVGRLADLVAIDDRSMYGLDPLGKWELREIAWIEDPKNPGKGFWSVGYGTPWGALVASVN